MARETELKILLDAAAEKRLRRSPVLRELRGGAAPVSRRLVSVYYDTAGNDLAAAKIALRLRKTGRTWVQTVKRSKSAMTAGFSSLEEVETPAPGGRLDLGLITDAELRDAVEAAVNSAPLAPVFETRMHRDAHRLSLPEGHVELALDAGEIVAGGKSAPLHEAELELLDGDPSAIYSAARLLFPEGPVRFSGRSKAARGYALAATGQAVRPPEPRKARAVSLDRTMAADDAARAVFAECLDQIAVNMNVTAVLDDPEGPHQLRVGLRRLRTALTMLKPVTDVILPRRLSTKARDLGAIVGRLRDLDVLRADLLAPLGGGEDAAALDALVLARLETVRAEVRAALTGREATAFLFDLGGFAITHGRRGAPARAAPDVFAEALEKRWAKVAKLGGRIDKLDIEQRHDLRKELKKFRYTVEFAAPLFSKKHTAPFLKILKRLQESFGTMSDLAMAEALLTGPDAIAAGHPLAERAAGRILGWHGHASKADWASARTGWQRLEKATPFWR